MTESILQQLRELLSSHDPFVQGYLGAMAVILLIALVLLVLKIVFAVLFRTRGCSAITVSGKNGDMIVSREAVTDLIRSQSANFSELTVERVRLYKNRSQQIILLCASCAASGHLPERVAELQQEIKNSLRESLGITSVGKVNIKLRKLTRSFPNPSAAPEIKVASGTPDSEETLI